MHGLITGQPYSLWAVLALAFILDASFGDPPWLWRRLAHPVALAGRLTAWLERRLNRAGDSPGMLQLYGLFTTITIIALAALAGWLVMAAASALPPLAGLALEALAGSTLIAFRGLLSHVAAVARALNEGLADGRAAVAHIAGRDPESLDAPGVARTAVESLAENLSDGVIAPLFWAALLGLPGLAAYRALNTLDSMIGHSTARYHAFGFAAARLDDWANWAPARLTGAFICLAALLIPKARCHTAFTVMRRDASHHTSPNAGWPEAALAGALDFRLAGPRRYNGQTVPGSWMGEGRTMLDATDIHAALSLCLAAGIIAAGVIVAVLAAASALAAASGSG